MSPLVFDVEPGTPVHLADYDPRYRADLKREEAELTFVELAQELGELQELLYAASTHSLLVILQGMDTSGKDGTVRRVFASVDPLGIHVTPFKVPTAEERARDFLWRVHRVVPQRGEIGIFNRSHYEDVLVPRVHSLISEDVWHERLHNINDFERLLVSNDTLIIKIFLHISKEEQEDRLLKRETEVVKAWKLSAQDWSERELWDDYQGLYEAVLAQSSTEIAPWIIVPADRKWYRNLAVATAVVETLRPFKANWLQTLEEMGATATAELRRLREVQREAQEGDAADGQEGDAADGQEVEASE